MSPSEKVNTTAEVEVDGDDDLLDFRTLRLSPEEVSVDHGGGTDHHGSTGCRVGFGSDLLVCFLQMKSCLP